MATTIGEAVVKLTFDGKDVKASLNKISRETEAQGKSTGSKWASAWTVAAGNLIAKGVSKIASAISGSMSSAISRIDILNNFPKVMQSIGVSAEEASKSTQMMSDHLDGLPTSLDAAASDIQKLAATMGNLADGEVNATSVGLGLNDMFLAGGKGTEYASRAMEQYNQMLSHGKVDMQAWSTMVDAAPGQMNQLAESILGAGKNQSDLYEAMKEGTVTFDDMNAAIVKLDKEGGAGFASFNDQAIASTDGIATSLQNIGTSFTKVLADVATGSDAIGGHLEQLFSRITSFVTKMAPNLVTGFQKLMDGLAKAMPELISELVPVVVNSVIDISISLVEHIPEMVQHLIDLFVTIVNTLAPRLPEIMMSIVNAIIDTLLTLTSPENLQAVLSAVIQLLMAIVQAIPQVIIALVNALPAIINNIKDFLTNPENMRMIIDAAIQLFIAILEAIPQIIIALAEALPDIIVAIVEILTNPDIIVMILDAAVTMFFAIVDAVPEIAGALLEALGKLFEGIKEALGTALSNMGETVGKIAQWVKENVFDKVANFFGDIIENIKTGIENFVHTAEDIIGAISGWINDNVIQPVASFFSGLWEGVKTGVEGAINTVKDVFHTVVDWINAKVILPIRQFFSGLWLGIMNGVKAVKEFVSNVFGTIVGIIKAPINGIIGGINGVLGKINSIKIPDWVPVIGGAHTNFGMIPTLAQGGYADNSTQAIIGEAGKEVVLPLEANTDNWSGLLAETLLEKMSEQDEGDYNGQPLVVNLNLDGSVVEQVLLNKIRRAV